MSFWDPNDDAVDEDASIISQKMSRDAAEYPAHQTMTYPQMFPDGQHITLADFENLAEQHDWFPDYSDDPRTRSRAYEEREALIKFARENKCKTFRDVFNRIHTAQLGYPYDFPKEQHCSTENPKTNNAKTDNTMKDALTLIFTILIAPLIEAIDRHAAAISGKGTLPAPTTKAVEAEVVDTPAPKKAKAAKAAPAPEPEAEPEVAAKTYDDVKTLAKPHKDTQIIADLLAFVKKKYKADKIADAGEENMTAIYTKLEALIAAADADDDM